MSTTSAAAPTRPGVPDRPGAPPAARSALRSALVLPEVRWAALSLALFALGGAAQLLGAPPLVWWALYLACYAAGGWEPALEGLRALRERTLDVDVLMVVAALAAAAIGQVLDGALLIVIFTTSGALEAFVTRRTADSVGALLTLAPDRATRVHVDDRLEEVDVEQLAVGDTVLVRPGERVGADGVVVAGSSDVDQSSVTGEPLPVGRGVGDEVFAGTVNGTGALRVEVRRPAGESVVARIVAMVAEAAETKARSQLFIERVEQRYSVVVVAATLTLLGVPLAAGAEFEPTLLRAMTFMIVASPCALVLATMPPLLATIANAGRHGVLVRSAVALEELRGVDVVALDKTGTLTRGEPVVGTVHPLAGTSVAEVLALAAAAERSSEHPVAGAVLAAAREREVVVPEARDVVATPGRGVTGRVGGRVVQVGAPALLEAAGGGAGSGAGGGAGAEVAELVAAVERAGDTAVVVIVDDRPLGVLAVSDALRPEAADAVARIHDRLGARTVLLTGDHATAGRAVAARAGVPEVHAGLLPEDKAAHLRGLADRGHRTALVGDGINDAPAMATAHVGIALGRRGSDLAVETADVILVRDDLGTVPTLAVLARRAHRVVVANLVIAGTVIVALVTWDVAGTLPLPLGVAGHEGSTVVVALNGLRLLRRSAWDRAAA
ncbi:heavy metal translocating P-type ATPase [Nocardioides sp. CPCC 205120]|uniref:heavy metal translocating P-type ATPase n=1 Tax=Nocardioides sp. CPCC 205120 TaxID=3406462 RepID=UPI003B5152DD